MSADQGRDLYRQAISYNTGYPGQPYYPPPGVPPVYAAPPQQGYYPHPSVQAVPVYPGGYPTGGVVVQQPPPPIIAGPHVVPGYGGYPGGVHGGKVKYGKHGKVKVKAPKYKHKHKGFKGGFKKFKKMFK